LSDKSKVNETGFADDPAIEANFEQNYLKNAPSMSQLLIS